MHLKWFCCKKFKWIEKRDAQGDGRYHYLVCLHFTYIARGLLFEVENASIVAQNIGDRLKTQLNCLRRIKQKIEKSLNAYSRLILCSTVKSQKIWQPIFHLRSNLINSLKFCVIVSSFLVLILAVITPSSTFGQVANLSVRDVKFKTTFHSIGLYWKPVDGSSDNECILRYRETGKIAWKEAQPLWFDNNIHAELAEHSHEYRGSLVNLIPGTSYDLLLKLRKTGTQRRLRVKTWSETFPIKEVRKLPSGTRNSPVVITEGGSASKGYIVYQASPGSVLDFNNLASVGIQIDASYVILRGVTIINPQIHGIELKDVTDVVLENCDISGWGRNKTDSQFGENLNSAIYSNSTVLERIVIQRCSLHHPRSDSNSWSEAGHPEGPQAITFKKGNGNFVIRYNNIFSDEQHVFNDAMGATTNKSFQGFPNRDSDIYGNYVSNVWDDGLEIEGACMNVRVFGNFIDHVYNGIGLASTSLGPNYIYRNITNFTRKATDEVGGGEMAKLGANAEELNFASGRIYILHNTILQPQGQGMKHGINFSANNKVQINIFSRNNVLFTRGQDAGSFAVNDPTKSPLNDFDFDLYNGNINAHAGAESSGIKGIPTFDSNNPYALKSGSLGFDVGVLLANINDGFKGNGPDMGAAELGAPLMMFGADANWTKWLEIKVRKKATCYRSILRTIGSVAKIGVAE